MDQESRWLLADKYNGIESDEFRHDLKLLQEGVPLAYIIGWTPFLGTKIWLDTVPLIPRLETEFWVEKAITEIKRSEVRPLIVLDLCAGSGCVGVAVLKHVPNSVVHFAELVDDHHQTIRKNIIEVIGDRLPARTYPSGTGGLVTERSKQIGGDLFEFVTDKYDYILTNPPYIDPELSERVESSVSLHEPSVALYGGAGGMEIIERIIREAPKHLNPGGVLYVEHEPEQEEKIKTIAPQAEIYEDQFRVKRYSRITF